MTISRRITITDSFVSSVAGGSPAISALTVDYAKQHIRALGNTDDALVQVMIDAAASYFEEQTGRQLLTATRDAWLDAFPFIGMSGSDARIELPRPPLIAVTNVRYVDSNGTLRSFDDGASPVTPFFTYVAPVGDYCRRGIVEPIYGKTWPTARAGTKAARITYTCGYGSSAAAMPKLIRQVLCYLVAHYDTFRAPVQEGAVNEVPIGMRQMLDGFKYTAYPQQVLYDYASANASMIGWSQQ